MVPAWADDYVGIPFRDHGRDRAGCDCWGLVRLVLAERAGVEVPSYSAEYDDAMDGAALEPLIGHEKMAWRAIAAGTERVFDVVLMKGYFGTGRATRAADFHVGVVVAPGTLLHVEPGPGAHLGRYRRDRRVAHRVRAFFRHADLDG